ncbi:restriction endonuclease subunit S [Mesomycoplasma ovipneumoniae]|uniref:restriction endonuclease subunit S n=1 Tax=Mesomycoplasma ovipneumoniae TaxID=29562 RepID=UPI002DDBA8E2|nr:restriction endonuclease subunit S [Mesomycoplasma ovipneumoniae]
MKKLMNYAIYSNEKLSIDGLDVFYVGVENILPNKKGIKPSSFVPKTGKYTKFDKNDILLGNIGPYLKKIWLADKSGLASPDVLVIKPLESRFGKYIYANLLNDSFFQYAMLGVKGSILPRCDKSHIMNYSIPDVKNKEKIGDFIYFINKKIELNNKINDNLEKQMNFIFKNMMSKAMNNKIKGEYVSVKNLTQVVTGKEDANFSDENGKYKFFTCSNEALKCNEYRFNSSSVLIAGNGDFNVKHYTGKFNAYQRTYVLTPQKDYYALLYLSSVERINALKLRSTGSIIKFITKNDIESIPVFIPWDKNILNILNQLLSLKDKKSNENEYLASLRDYLLPLLLNGQVAIED